MKGRKGTHSQRLGRILSLAKFALCTCPLAEILQMTFARHAHPSLRTVAIGTYTANFDLECLGALVNGRIGELPAGRRFGDDELGAEIKTAKDARRQKEVLCTLKVGCYRG